LKNFWCSPTATCTIRKTAETLTPGISPDLHTEGLA
jgi:hypothetical protein